MIEQRGALSPPLALRGKMAVTEAAYAEAAGLRPVSAPVGVHGTETRLAPPGGPFVPTECQDTNVRGEACKNRPVKLQLYCAAHIRKRARDGS